MNKSIVYKKIDGFNHVYYEDDKTPELSYGQVLVKVNSAGLNRADLLQLNELYEVPKGETETPGIEICGEVIKVAIDVSNVYIGKRICAVVSGGGFSKLCVVEENMLIIVPDGWNDFEAAAFPESALTASEALFRLANLKKGQEVLISAGSSGIGTYMIQIANMRGLIVTTLTRDVKKTDLLKNLGAKKVLISGTVEFKKEIEVLEKKQCFDAIIDFMGGEYTSNFMKIIKVKGVIVMAGLMAGRTSKVNWVEMINRQITFKPLTLRMKSKIEKNDVNHYFNKMIYPEIKSKMVKPFIDKVFNIEDLTKAYAYMEKGNHVGKIVIKIQ